MNKQVFVICLLCLLVIGLPLAGQVSAANINHQKVVICHAHASESNPFNQETVDDDAVDGVGNADHNREGHQNGEDIIPPGSWDADGRNWNTQGQVIWNNGCNVSQPTPTATPILTPTPTLELTPTITPTATPSATVTQTPCGDECKPKEVTKTQPAAGICTAGVPGNVGNIYVATGIPNDNKLEVRWSNASPNEGAEKAHIMYTDGKPGDWRYALLDTNNDGTEVIGGLVNGKHYWFVVALVHECSVGSWSNAFDPTP